MRVAFFTPYLPYPPDAGGKIRSYYLLQALALRLEVDLFTVYDGDGPSRKDVEALQKHCREVVLFRLERTWRTRDRIWRTISPIPRSVSYFCTPASLAQAEKRLREGGYDAVIADELSMTPYAELTAEVPRLIMRQKVDSAHYREMARARIWGIEKALDLIEATQLRRYERIKMPLFQAFLACSRQDAALIRRDAPGIPAVVIANGADLSQFTPPDRPRAAEPTLLYVGSMHYYPNVDAVQFFFQEVYETIRREVPGVRVQIVGHNPPPPIQELARLPGVEVTGSVPDVRPYYGRATVFIVPLRLGGGTRLKVVEAMAMQLPVVSTTVGAEGLDTHPGENILIADDAASFAANVLRLLTDADLSARLASGGQALARRYDWMEITRPWADLVERVCRQGKQAGV
jgi:sugar transferase (PEP-CTERM/EpsH1 system associated)